MKIAVRFAVFLMLFPGWGWAQDNPYLPGNGGYSPAPNPFISYSQRQQFLQDILAPPDSAVGGNDENTAAQSQQTPVSPNYNNEFQELRSQQEDNVDALTREKMDREREIQALKDAFETQINALQRKIDEQQTEIDNLRYQSRF